jgi:hypothetical protein
VSLLHAAGDTDRPDVTFIADLDPALHIRMRQARTWPERTVRIVSTSCPFSRAFVQFLPGAALHTGATITACCDPLSAACEE